MTRTVVRPWITNAILLGLGFALLLLSKQLVKEFTYYSIGFSGVAGWSVFVYLIAVVVILTQPTNRYTLGIILAVAVLCSLVPLFVPPVMSSDVYRYVWDGLVQHAGISPYRYIPADPALKFLQATHKELFDHINRRNYAHTIYPPGAEFLFFLVTWINASVSFMKLGMVLCEGLTFYALIQILSQMGVNRDRVLIFAWCPLLVWEISSSGHIDAAVMPFVCLALLARLRKRDTWTGVFLGLAILMKLYPFVLFPALYRRGKWKMPAASIAVVAFGYACYASVGLRVFGFLGGYMKEEGIDSGTRFFLVDLTKHIFGLQHDPIALFYVFGSLLFAVLVLWCWRTSSQTSEADENVKSGQNFLPQSLSLALAMMLLFSPHYAWYVAWLIPFLVLVPNLPVFTYVCGLFYLCVTPYGAGTQGAQYSLNSILYSLVALAAVLEFLLRRWPIWHRFASPASLSAEPLKKIEREIHL